MSTCLPPLYRPPNPSPDLQNLINDALFCAAGPRTPSSLLDYHVNVLNDGDDNRTNLPPANQLLPSEPSAKKGKTKAAVGLRKVASVKPSEERGDAWDDEVDVRLSEVLGLPGRPPAPIQNGRSPSQVPQLSPISSPLLPSTQTMGHSSLAVTYSRNRKGESTELEDEPVSITDGDISDDEENIPPMPPSSQDGMNPLMGHGDEEDEEVVMPFRPWGGPRAVGDLPKKRQTVHTGRDARKRIRGEGGLAGGFQ